MTKWSPKQEEAINTLGQNIIVSASAGAGKTAVLVERLAKRILIDKISVNEVLAVTFTEAAAGEMKNRLYNRLNSEIRTDDNKTFIEEQLTLLNSAYITTIDSFCLSIIKENYFIINLDPLVTNNILSDEDSANLELKAHELALNEYLTTNKEDYLELCTYFDSNPLSSASLDSIIQQLAKQSATHLDSEQFFKDILDRYNSFDNIKDVTSDIQNAFYNYYGSLLNDLINITQEFIQYLDEHYDEQSLPSKVRNAATALIQQSKQMQDNINDQDYNSFYNAATIIEFKVSKTNLKEDELAKKKLDNVKSAIKKLKENLISETILAQNSKELYPIVDKLVNYAKCYTKNYRLLKQQAKVMDFVDIELFAYQILKAEDNYIAKKYQKRFKEIMIDEFQDTNQLQNDLIVSLSNGHNIFRVGDVKQSIYRFRGAKPSLMSELLTDNINQKVIYFEKNYRSTSTIVQYCNALFEQLMNVKPLEQSYLELDKVQSGRNDSIADKVEFHLLNKTNNVKLDDNEEGFDGNKAEYIINLILKMKAENPNSNWKDYCVLVRSHQVKEQLKYEFEKYNVPTSMAVRNGFYNAPAISSLISFLTLVDHDDSEQDLVAILVSDYYQLSANQLASLKIKYQSISAGIKATNHQLIQDLNQAREILKESGLLSLIKYLLTINNYYQLHTNSQDRTNLNLLMEKLVQLQKQQTYSLAQYLTYLSASRNINNFEGRSNSMEDDVVKVMTIHQSKGLEFKTVILWSTSSSQTVKTTYLPSLGLSLKYLSVPYRITYDSIQSIAIDYVNKNEELAEYIRLLYVALTRAADRLIIVDKADRIIRDNLPINYTTITTKTSFSNLVYQGSEKISSKLYSRSDINSFTHLEALKADVKEVSFTTYPQIPTEFNYLTPSSSEKHFAYPLDFSNKIKANQRGTYLHEAVEQLPNSIWTHDDYQQLSIQDYQLLDNLNNQPLFNQLRQQKVFKEYSFYVKKENKIIHGFMDYLAIDGDTVTVVDFKSDRNTTRERLIASYTNQINLYVEALTIIYPDKQIKSYLYSFALDEFIEITQ